MRITKWNGNKYVLTQGRGSFREIADRLAAYENTGLEPEEIKKLLRGEVNPAKSKRIFISGPISGTDDYMERFAEAEEHLKAEGYLPINPTVFSQHLLNAEFGWEEFMDVTMALLKQCDSIYMLDGWKNSVGACCEIRFAAEHQYTVLEQILID